MAGTTIRFSLKVIGQERKSIVAAVGGSLDAVVKYTGVPACAYQIGGWTLDRESVLHSPELEESELPVVRSLLSALQAAEFQTEGLLTVTVPSMAEQAAENLGNILKSKQQLLKSALQSETEIRLDGNVLSCFHATLDADTVLAYLLLMAKLCDLAKTLRYASPVERQAENQKYAFRCFLLRLGFIGKNYKMERKILLAPLEGKGGAAIRKLKKYKPTAFKAKDSVYSKAAADYAVGFIECLAHTKGTWAGKSFELIDWQEQIIRDVFGILKPDGYRQFTNAYVEIPKKMGKSELAAAVALLLTCGDHEERAEVYGCAADRQQASIVFDVASDMVKQCPALAKRVKILASLKRLVYLPTNSFYQVLSAEAYTKHGLNIHGVVFDELHAQPNRKLYDVMLRGSGDARMQPLYFLITTAGDNTNSICWEVHQKAKDILEGRKHDPTFYPVIYGADESDDWTDPKVWKKANPSLGITVGIDKVRTACESAKENPAEENAFRQLRLNQWIKQSIRWMPMEKWDKCAFAVDPKQLEGRICYGGLDLSSTTDITAFVLVFPPEDEDDKYSVLPYFWIPEENLDLRVRRDHVNYDLWERQKFLQTTEGNVVHYGFIESFIEELGMHYNIREIAFDRWGAVQMTQNLENLGFTVVPFGQGFKDMSPPTKELMKLTLEEKLAHGGHPVLRWMMDNIFIRTDPAGNIKPDKEKSTEKIDGAVATIMALDRAIRCGNNNPASIYDGRGLLIL